MKKMIFITLLIVFCCLSLSAQKKQAGLADEEYAMLSSILDGISVIENKTIPARIFADGKEGNSFDGNVSIFRLREAMPNLSDETVKDFNSNNDKEYALEKKFNINGEYELISDDEISKIFYKAENLEKAWESFRKKYPKSGGFVQFSRVGFSSDKKQAVIYFTYSCGSLCASGDFIFYVKEKEKWVEKGKVNLWVS